MVHCRNRLIENKCVNTSSWDGTYCKYVELFVTNVIYIPNYKYFVTSFLKLNHNCGHTTLCHSTFLGKGRQCILILKYLHWIYRFIFIKLGEFFIRLYMPRKGFCHSSHVTFFPYHMKVYNFMPNQICKNQCFNWVNNNLNLTKTHVIT